MFSSNLKIVKLVPVYFREENSEALNLIECFKSLNKDTAEAEVVEAIKKHGKLEKHLSNLVAL